MPTSVPHVQPGQSITAVALTDLVGGRYVAVRGTPVDGNVRVGYPAASGDPVLGLTAYDVKAGQRVTLWTAGVLDIEAGATITAGTHLQANATGQAIPLASGTRVGTSWDDAASGARLRSRLH